LFFNLRAISRLTSFSFNPVGPIVPESLPPWPGSIQIKVFELLSAKILLISDIKKDAVKMIKVKIIEKNIL
jgi:hypothetical protein